MTPEFCQQQFAMACGALKNFKPGDPDQAEACAFNFHLIEQCVVIAGRRKFPLKVPNMDPRQRKAIEGITLRVARKPQRRAVLL